MLIERLASHERLRAVPRHELEWLAAHGTIRTLPRGAFLARTGDPREQLHLYIVLAGSILTYVQRSGVQRRIRGTNAGDFGGLLPFSRMVHATADLLIDEPVELLQIDQAFFPAMIRECPGVTAACVHSMLERTHALTESDLHDEKMFSLGKLAAGLAHELNNPASAAARSAQALTAAHRAMDTTADALAEAKLSPSDRVIVGALAEPRADRVALNDSPIERAEREDAVAEWLEAHAADTASAALFADTGLGVDDLRVLDELPSHAIAHAVAWIAARIGARSLAAEIDRATRRIHDLVAAVRGFTQMDRPLVVELIAIGPGIRDSVMVLEPKARGRFVTIDIDVADDLPFVRASAAEMNQVWASLLDNAIDAAPSASCVSISAAKVNDAVLVRVVDEGAGIPSDIIGRIFDPFFTTKPIGQGRGLGLDIARRLVRLMDGQIDVMSRPGRTEFQVSLPIGH